MPDVEKAAALAPAGCMVDIFTMRRQGLKHARCCARRPAGVDGQGAWSVFFGEGGDLGGGEDGAVFADVDVADVASAAFAEAAFHAVFEGGDDVVLGEAEVEEDGEGEFDHDGGAADEGNGVV